MAKTVTLEQVEKLVEQLPPAEQLKLIAHICEQLSGVDFSAIGKAEQPERKSVLRYLLQYP